MASPSWIGADYLDFGWKTTASSGNQTYTGTTQTGVFALAFIGYESGGATVISVSSVTDSKGNTWKKYGANNATQGNDGKGLTANVYTGVEVWYAENVSYASGDTFDVTLSGAPDNACAHIQLFSNVNATHSFDLNAALPALANVGTAAATAEVPITTNTADILVIAAAVTASNNSLGAPTFNGAAAGFSGGAGNTSGTYWCRLEVSMLQYSAAQSGLLVSWGSQTDETMIGFALTADTQSVPTPHSFGTLIG